LDPDDLREYSDLKKAIFWGSIFLPTHDPDVIFRLGNRAGLHHEQYMRTRTATGTGSRSGVSEKSWHWL